MVVVVGGRVLFERCCWSVEVRGGWSWWDRGCMSGVQYLFWSGCADLNVDIDDNSMSAVGMSYLPHLHSALWLIFANH